VPFGIQMPQEATSPEEHAMWKQGLAACAVVAVTGLTLAYAQPLSGPGRDQGGPNLQSGQINRWQMSADDLRAFTDARVAAMKAGLQLTPDQERNWRPFEDAYRNLAKLRADRIIARRSGQVQPPNNIVEFMQRRADQWTEGAAAFKKFADAAVPLYQSLDDAQKRRFGILAHALRPRPARFAMRGEGMHRWGMQHPGFERGIRPGFGPGMMRERFGENRPGSDPLAEFGLQDDDAGNDSADSIRSVGTEGAR
jgi:hypothetical protein